MDEFRTQALSVYSQIRDVIYKIIEGAQAENPDYIAFSRLQLHYYSERCQSINLLLQEGKLWDCEMLFRAALECATRFIFVSIADAGDRPLRLKEYFVFFRDLDDLHRSDKAKFAVDANKANADISMLMGGVILSPEREAELRITWTKSKKAALKQKWSFSEMVKYISRYYGDDLDLRLYPTYLHSYGISSHLIHADLTAIDLCWDRMTREPEERSYQINAHAARLLTDQVSILFLCWRTLAHAVKIDFPNENFAQEFLAMEKAANKYHETFADSQRHKYE